MPVERRWDTSLFSAFGPAVDGTESVALCAVRRVGGREGDAFRRIWSDVAGVGVAVGTTIVKFAVRRGRWVVVPASAVA